MTSTADETIDVLRGVFARFSHPFDIVSDNGPQLTSVEFESFLTSSGIRHQIRAPFNPKTNGLAERVVRSAKESMAKMKNQPGSYVKLQRFLLSYRNTPHARTGRYPVVIMFGRPLPTHLALLLPVPRGIPEETVPAKFHVGQPVLARDYRPWEPKWQPGKIENHIGTYLYNVRVENGVLIERHVDQLLTGPTLRAAAVTNAVPPPVTVSPCPSPEVAVESVCYSRRFFRCRTSRHRRGIAVSKCCPTPSPRKLASISPRRSTRVSKAPVKLNYGADFRIIS